MSVFAFNEKTKQNNGLTRKTPSTLRECLRSFSICLAVLQIVFSSKKILTTTLLSGQSKFNGDSHGIHVNWVYTGKHKCRHGFEQRHVHVSTHKQAY